jgi:hypothetical protein
MQACGQHGRVEQRDALTVMEETAVDFDHWQELSHA